MLRLQARRALLLTLVARLAAGALLPPVRSSALPLTGKRVVHCGVRRVGWALSGALIEQGGQPIWCPPFSSEPLASYAALDDALMRLTEYDAIVLSSSACTDAVASRALHLADGDKEAASRMLAASDVEICAVGSDALHCTERLGVPASIVPLEPTVDGLALQLVGLTQLAAPTDRVLFCTAEPPPGVPDDAYAEFCAAMKAAGSAAAVERLETHALVAAPAAHFAAERALLRGGEAHAVVLTSPQEARAVVGGDDWPEDGGAGRAPLVFAVGAATADAARAGGAPADRVFVVAGGAHALDTATGARAAVAALGERLSEGKLLF